MFNRVAEKIRTAKTTEEKKKWIECCYAVLEYGGAWDGAYSHVGVFLDFDVAEAIFKESLDDVNEKIETGTYSDESHAQGISLHKIEYYCGIRTELKSYEYNDETGKFEEEE